VTEISDLNRTDLNRPTLATINSVKRTRTECSGIIIIIITIIIFISHQQQQQQWSQPGA